MPRMRVRLTFPTELIQQPIVYHLVKDYNLIINIFRAKVTADEEGYLLLDVTGEEVDIEHGMEFVKSFDVTIDPVNKGVRWNRERCTHCGNCLSHCPTHALRLADAATRVVTFVEEECIECLNCLDNCPFGACSSAF